jgi:hypothetical protein
VQAVAGADVRVTGPLRGYGSLQFTSLEQNNMRATAGVRVVARTSPLADEAKRELRRVAPASLTPERNEQLEGARVRVTLASGIRRHGDFVAIDDTSVVVRDKLVDMRYALNDVLMVETAHHKARNGAIVGAIAGFLLGYVASCALDDGSGCYPEFGAALAGFGAGAGGLAGALSDWRTANSHVIYALKF